MYHFEIHLTINALAENKITEFEKACQNLGGKAVIIELPMGKNTQQPMFTFTQKSENLADIFVKIEPIKQELAKQNFEVIRTKIEIPAEQAEALLVENPETLITNGYFEWHGKVTFQEIADLSLLKNIALITQSHLSKNALKNLQNQRFLTIRQYGILNFSHAKNAFYQKTQRVKNHLQNYPQFTLVKSQHELCIYDDKISLDTGWLDRD